MREADAAYGTHAPGGVAAARDALAAWVRAGGAFGRVFLQLRLLQTDADRYEIRNLADVGRSLDSLDPVISDPFAAREIAQTTDGGEHRPLKTTPDLRRGWAFTGLDERALWTALDYLYPACAVHWHAGRTGTLRVTDWRDVAARQSGIYAAVGLLADTAVRDTAWACCADEVCLRKVEWQIDPATPLDAFGPEAEHAGARVPCPEACSVFISFARKTLTLERSRREPIPGLVPMSAAELEQLRAVVDAAATGELGAAREGDFAEPTNSRRVRYLAARLRAAAPPAAAAEGVLCEGCPRPVRCANCPLT